MLTFRRTTASELDSVDVFDRLAAYEVTSASGLDLGYASLPGRAEPAPPPTTLELVAAPTEVPADRRGAERYALTLRARVKVQGDDVWQTGRSVDASVTGLSIELDVAPDHAGYVDVELGDGPTVIAWARVVGWTPTQAGSFRWRLRLISFSPTYPDLLADLTPLETGYQPRSEPSTAPEPLVTVGARVWDWAPLLDRGIA